MSLPHILLGMLDRPRTGYDLKTEFEEGSGYFWSAELSQIYPALKTMLKSGWVTDSIVPSKRGPERRLYRRTPTGRAELFRWLSNGPVIGPERIAYVGQLLYLGQMKDLRRTREFLTALRDEMAARVRFFRSVLEEVQRETEGQDEENVQLLHDRFALRLGMEVAVARVRVCDQSLKSIEVRLDEEDTDV